MVPVFTWTGFYIGAQGGGGWSSSTMTNVTGGPEFPAGFVHNKNNQRGAIAGGYAGYNYQMNQLVVGVEGEYSWADLKGRSTDIGPTGVTSNITEKVKWIAMATGRVGYAADNWLLYAKGGLGICRLFARGNDPQSRGG